MRDRSAWLLSSVPKLSRIFCPLASRNLSENFRGRNDPSSPAPCAPLPLVHAACQRDCAQAWPRGNFPWLETVDARSIPSRLAFQLPFKSLPNHGCQWPPCANMASKGLVGHNFTLGVKSNSPSCDLFAQNSYDRNFPPGSR